MWSRYGCFNNTHSVCFNWIHNKWINWQTIFMVYACGKVIYRVLIIDMVLVECWCGVDMVLTGCRRSAGKVLTGCWWKLVCWQSVDGVLTVTAFPLTVCWSGVEEVLTMCRRVDDGCWQGFDGVLTGCCRVLIIVCRRGVDMVHAGCLLGVDGLLLECWQVADRLMNTKMKSNV